MFLTNLKMGRKRLAVLGFVGAALLAAPALATLPSGVAGIIHARGTVSEKVKVREPKNTDFVTQQITIQPGGHTGWHTHPGAALVTVKSGTLTLTGLRHRGDDDDDDYRGGRRGRCETQSFAAGQAFVDSGHGHVHIGRNLGPAPVELWVTYTGVPAGGAFRIDAADPGC